MITETLFSSCVYVRVVQVVLTVCELNSVYAVT